MRQKFILLLLFFITCNSPIKLQAQSLILKTKNGSELVKPINSLKTIYFSNNNLLVNYSTIASETYNLSIISKIYFKSVASGTELNVLDHNSLLLSVYPNPANNLLYIQNAPEENSNVIIHRLDVVQVLRTQISGENKCIQIGSLDKGMYLLKVGNQVVKFIKV